MLGTIWRGGESSYLLADQSSGENITVEIGNTSPTVFSATEFQSTLLSKVA